MVEGGNVTTKFTKAAKSTNTNLAFVFVEPFVNFVVLNQTSKTAMTGP